MEVDLETGEEKWIREGKTCGYGDNILSLDDFVSSKLMGETVGASNNIIVFIPENLDPTKVFATTELEQIFKNDAFKYINGIPKSELEVIYRMGEAGKQSVYDILKATAKEVVGDTEGIDLQAQKLLASFSENGILNSESSAFSLSTCYDANGNFTGVELESPKSGTLMEKPKNTASSKEVVSASNTGTAEFSSDVGNKQNTNKDLPDEQSGNKKTDADVEEKIATEKENNSESKINENKNNTGNTEETGKGEDVKSKDTDTDTVKKEELTSNNAKKQMEIKEIENGREELAGYEDQISIEYQEKENKADYENYEGNIETAKSNYDTAVLNLENAKAQRKSKLLQMKEQYADELKQYGVAVEEQYYEYENKDIIALYDGIVKDMYIDKEGAVVSATQVVAEILPDTKQLIVEAEIKNSDIGFVEAGQEADVKIDTYDYQKYGKIKGTVIYISPDSIENEQKEKIYKANILLDNIETESMDLSSGMECSVEVKTDRRRVIEFFLEPLTEAFDNSLNVR